MRVMTLGTQQTALVTSSILATKPNSNCLNKLKLKFRLTWMPRAPVVKFIIETKYLFHCSCKIVIHCLLGTQMSVDRAHQQLLYSPYTVAGMAKRTMKTNVDLIHSLQQSLLKNHLALRSYHSIQIIPLLAASTIMWWAFSTMFSILNYL